MYSYGVHKKITKMYKVSPQKYVQLWCPQKKYTMCKYILFSCCLTLNIILHLLIKTFWILWVALFKGCSLLAPSLLSGQGYNVNHKIFLNPEYSVRRAGGVYRRRWGGDTNKEYTMHKDKHHTCLPIPLAPQLIRVKSCVWCLFWTNRSCMAVTSILLYISLSN